MLEIAAAFEKVQFVEALTQIPGGRGEIIPELPARDIGVVLPDAMPQRAGLASLLGQRRLLHDLANIELQAMELCYRELLEYPDAPEEFREDLFMLLKNEATHFDLCLKGLAELGGQWGEFPVHMGLWFAQRPEDSLIDRILIVHRYLEGNGLDAGETLLKKLTGVAQGPVHAIVGQIAREELGHVAFGSRWYKDLCRADGIDPADDFKIRFERLMPQLPRRIEHIHRDLRKKAGFSAEEISFLEQKRESWTRFKKL